MLIAAERAEARPRLLTGIGLVLIHVGAGAAALPMFFSWGGLIVAAVLVYLTGAIGICLGYHRLLTHRSLRVPRAFEYFIATLGALALQGGPIEWVATHRAHHAFSDTERDPHSARKGFLWSHMIWLFASNSAWLTKAEQQRFARDLADVPYYRFLDRTSVALQLALAVVLFTFGGWSWVVWGVFARLVVTYHVTWLVNSAAHSTGYRTYDARDLSTNNWWVALLAWGEGWHNNHHAFPSSARHGLRWYEIDLTWLTIRLLALARMATKIKVPSRDMLRRRLIGDASMVATANEVYAEP